MEKLRVKQDKAHRLEWELKKRAEEREELRHALQQCQDALGNERGTIEEMAEGGENLKIKQNVNK
jgi:septal ring factor EnvC (AmiA/AmiB activator)